MRLTDEQLRKLDYDKGYREGRAEVLDEVRKVFSGWTNCYDCICGQCEQDFIRELSTLKSQAEKKGE